MNKKELLKYLKTSRRVLAHVQFSSDRDGVHLQLVKSDFIKFVKGSDDDVRFDVGITDKSIWIN
jgi:hypothetical protein